MTKPFGGGYNILVLIGSKINSLNSLTNLNKLVSNILVAASFLILTFLTIKTFAPDVASNAETNIATSGSSVFSSSITIEDHVDTDITPTSTQSTYTSSSLITYTNTCPYGLNITVSSSTEETALIRTGMDDSTKTIPTIADSATTLQDNTWGYSLDNGATYKSIPPLSNPATVVNTTTQGAAISTLDLKLGVKISNTIPSGSYTNDIIYTVSVKPQCISYNLSWDLNGGTGAPGVSYAASDLGYGNTINLQSYTPSRTGYTFAGWKSSATGNAFPTSSTATNVNPTNAISLTLTAQWTPVTYTISYNLNGGSATNNTSYNIETNAFTLNNPTRNGYTFTGWSGTGLSGSANKSVIIPKGSTGNRSYTANWQAANISAISTMQDMTSSICSATAVGASKNLTDTRDNNVYTVRKLNDGKCWMVNNLKIINKTISSNDSNLPSGVTWTIPTSDLAAFTGAYNINAVYTESGEVYYSFFTATAGWGMESATSGNSPRDICPKGWRLPTG